MTGWSRKTEKVADAMRERGWGRGMAASVAERTKEQKDFDSGVLAASELLRLLTDDEAVALQIHAIATKIAD